MSFANRSPGASGAGAGVIDNHIDVPKKRGHRAHQFCRLSFIAEICGKEGR
jgi:hypothetical protein